jgi:hypothetical protein
MFIGTEGEKLREQNQTCLRDMGPLTCILNVADNVL